ncbi:hypothetical protein POTOM_047638 [Populus tomentosa]|uniref:Uncharacterized protein n=1 Tax=Populus tomentosa TaxID=118781 RepID=A0A8X7YDX1_POPTO|nr:hypothetical protein POTOM_047638 [Populus tomentosa]
MTADGLCDLSFTCIYAAKDIKDFCLNQCPKIFPQPRARLFCVEREGLIWLRGRRRARAATGGSDSRGSERLAALVFGEDGNGGSGSVSWRRLVWVVCGVEGEEDGGKGTVGLGFLKEGK